MRILIQRVSRASVEIDSQLYSQIGEGLLILVGVGHNDTAQDVEQLTSKVAKLRIFDDEQGVMNLDIVQAGGSALVVSQFTLQASTRKGNRPSYINAAPEPISRPLYELFAAKLAEKIGRPVPTGLFGADMQVSLINNGPVTIFLDTERA